MALLKKQPKKNNNNCSYEPPNPSCCFLFLGKLLATLEAFLMVFSIYITTFFTNYSLCHKKPPPFSVLCQALIHLRFSTGKVLVSYLRKETLYSEPQNPLQHRHQVLSYLQKTQLIWMGTIDGAICKARACAFCLL